MKNVTITLEEEVARWARVRAAEQDTSVSRWVGEVLKEKKLEDEAYSAAMSQYLAQPPRRLKSPGERYPTRDEVHDRAGLR